MSVAAQDKPNVIIINADDLGYGDVSCYGMERITTHNIDRLADEGVRFTNAHATAATSTPSRYSLLTGVYAWRQKNTGVANGDAAMIISPETPTLATLFKRNGYATAAVGKWHLGLGDIKGEQDWNGNISPNPSDIGFEYSYIMAATADRVPCVYIEQGEVVNLDPADPISVSYTTPFDGEPTGRDNPELLRMKSSHGHDNSIINGIGRIGYMTGGKSALWRDETIADSITQHAVAFIRENAGTQFFLYFATNGIHVPRVPGERFAGKSGMGPRGDAILELDWSVGEILLTLDELGLSENTIVIFTSDNGPVIDDGYADDAVELLGDHNPSGNMRGGKYSIFEAGTRIPFIVRWTDNIPAHKTNDALLSQVDLFASLANIIGDKRQYDEAMDSENHSDVLLEQTNAGRNFCIEDAYSRSITDGKWKYIASSNGSKVAWETGIETGCLPEEQLYNINKDPGEKKNVAEKYPEKVVFLRNMLESEQLLKVAKVPHAN